MKDSFYNLGSELHLPAASHVWKLLSKDECFQNIMNLLGVEELKAKVQRLQNLQQSKDKFPEIGNVKPPNYLWVVESFGDFYTYIDPFAKFLYAANLIDFKGKVKYFDYKLAYEMPGTIFSELTRFIKALSESTGYHRYFKGLVSVNIDEWVRHTAEDHFIKFIEYIAGINDRILAIFHISSDDTQIIESLEATLAAYIRIETVPLKFPNADELVGFMETKYFKKKGLRFKDDARFLLKESIEEISNGINFKGFSTVEKFADDILFDIYTSNTGKKAISADMLAEFNKNSEYVNRITKSTSLKMGFHQTKKEYSK